MEREREKREKRERERGRCNVGWDRLPGELAN